MAEDPAASSASSFFKWTSDSQSSASSFPASSCQTPPQSLERDSMLDTGDELSSDDSEFSLATTFFSSTIHRLKEKLKKGRAGSRAVHSSAQWHHSLHRQRPYTRARRPTSAVRRLPTDTGRGGEERLRSASVTPVRPHRLLQISSVSRARLDPMNNRLENEAESQRIPRASSVVQRQHADTSWGDGGSLVSSLGSFSPSHSVVDGCRSSVSSLHHRRVRATRREKDGMSRASSTPCMGRRGSGILLDDAKSSASSLLSVPPGEHEMDARSSVAASVPPAISSDARSTVSSSIRRLNRASPTQASPSDQGRREDSSGWSFWDVIMCMVMFLIATILYDMAALSLTSCSRMKPASLQGLSPYLEQGLHGQELPISLVVTYLQDYLHEHEAGLTSPLVMSFHGWTGVGKTFLTQDLLAYFGPGHVSSKRFYNHHFTSWANGQKSFKSQIMGHIDRCKLNILIFEEVDLYKPDAYSAVADTILMLATQKSPSPQVVFILIPTMKDGGHTIMQRYLDKVGKGMRRNRFSQADFVSDIKQQLGDWALNLYEKRWMVDIIPFLPLEVEQVMGCISDECKRWGRDCPAKAVQEILEDMDFEPINKTNRFVASQGCNDVERKVTMYLNCGRKCIGGVGRHS